MTTFRLVLACRLVVPVATYLLPMGWCRLFFKPSSQGETAYAKNTLDPAHTGALIVICNNLFLLFFGIARRQFKNSPFPTILAPILLLTLSIMPILDDVGAAPIAAFVGDCFLYHAAKSIISLGFLPLPIFARLPPYLEVFTSSIKDDTLTCG